MKITAGIVSEFVAAGRLSPHEPLYTRATVGFIAKNVRAEVLGIVDAHLAASMGNEHAAKFCAMVLAEIMAAYRAKLRARR